MPGKSKKGGGLMVNKSYKKNKKAKSVKKQFIKQTLGQRLAKSPGKKKK